MVTAFVAGATGHTGRVVVEALRRRGVRTVAHVRPDSPSVEQWRTRFAALGAEVDTTAWEHEVIAARLAALAPTHVFALLGTTRKRAGREGLSAVAGYEKIDYGMTAMLLAGAQACTEGPRFVYLSAAGVKDGTRNPYMAARAKVEAELVASGLPYVIARPSIIVGERDEARAGERIGAVAIDGVLGLVGALGGKKTAARYRSTTNLVLGEALVSIALDEATPRQHVAESEDLR